MFPNLLLPINPLSPPALQPGMALLGLPFDAVRLHYAACVQAGLVRRSMLEARDFEKALTAMERLTLGPWARRN
jgi:hypothetical protein